CPLQQKVFYRYPDTCPPTVRAVSGGPPRDNYYYAGRPGSCVPAAPVGNVHAAGPEIPPERFAEVSQGLLPGTGRLRMMGLVTPAGVAAGTFWDSRFGLPCYPGVA